MSKPKSPTVKSIRQYLGIGALTLIIPCMIACKSTPPRFPYDIQPGIDSCTRALSKRALLRALYLQKGWKIEKTDGRSLEASVRAHSMRMTVRFCINDGGNVSVSLLTKEPPKRGNMEDRHRHKLRWRGSRERLQYYVDRLQSRFRRTLFFHEVLDD